MPLDVTSIGIAMRARYQRKDPQRKVIDSQHEVHSVSTAIPTATSAQLFMHCGPCKDMQRPLTQEWRRGDRGQAIVISLERFGATWQRILCHVVQKAAYSAYHGSDMDAYVIYYVEQQGM